MPRKGIANQIDEHIMQICQPVKLKGEVTLYSTCSGRSGHVAAIVVAAYFLRSGRSGRPLQVDDNRCC